MAARDFSSAPSPRASAKAKKEWQRARDRELAASLDEEARALQEELNTIAALIEGGARTKVVSLAELLGGYASGWRTAELRLSGDLERRGRPGKLPTTGLFAGFQQTKVRGNPGAPTLYPAALKKSIVESVERLRRSGEARTNVDALYLLMPRLLPELSERQRRTEAKRMAKRLSDFRKSENSEK